MSKLREEKNNLCKDCWKWQEFKEKCFFYWKNKSSCSQFQDSVNSKEQFKTINERYEND